MTKENTKSTLRIILIIAGLYAAAIYVHDMLRLFIIEPNFCDFAVFYFLSDLLSQGINFMDVGPKTFQYLKEISGIPHICYDAPRVALYSPAFYVMVMPLTILDFNTANIIWFFINNMALLASILLLMKILAVKINYINLSVASFIVFFYQPLFENNALGQSNILILFMLVCALRTIMTSRWMLSGLFTACAVLVKPQYGFIILLFGIKKLYKPLLFTIFFYIAMNVLSVFVVGWQFFCNFFYPGLIEAGSHALNAATWGKNYSIFSALSQFSWGQYGSIIKVLHCLLFVSAALFSVVTFGGKFKKDLFPIEFSWFLGLVIAFLPLLEEHYLIALYIPLLLNISRIEYFSKNWQKIFVLGYLLLALRYSVERFEFFHFGLWTVLSFGKLLGLIFIMLTLLHCYKGMKRETIDGRRTESVRVKAKNQCI
jgi:glycosyl transferase family 87